MVHDTASVLFGVEGLQVIDAEPGAEGTVEVWAVTDHLAAAACPDCGTVSGRVHETVLARPRDVRRGSDPVRVWWIKRRRKCQDGRCERKTFTEWLPQVPQRCRVTGRLRAQAGAEVAGRGITPAEAARHAGVPWPVAHAAFAAAADPVLEQAPALVAYLGIDEHRRGRPRWRIDEQTGEYIFLADPEYGIKNLLVRNLEHLSPAQFAKVTDILGSDPAGQEIAAAWIAKEKLRHTLNLRARITGSAPCERNVRDRLFACCNWCHDEIESLPGQLLRGHRSELVSVRPRPGLVPGRRCDPGLGGQQVA